MSRRETAVYADLAALSRAAADTITSAATSAVASRQRFTIALAGGSTPRTLYQLLAAEYSTRIPWDAAHIFFGDERCVPPDHPDSNFRMAREALLDRIPGLASRAHRIRGEAAPAQAAAEYEAELRSVFPDGPRTTFDVALLGVGPDGHTASLFPGSPALAERARWAVAVPMPSIAPRLPRVTLTFPTLDGAAMALFLCAGADKHHILQAIERAGGSAGERYPAAAVHPRERLVWMVDAAAEKSAG